MGLSNRQIAIGALLVPVLLTGVGWSYASQQPTPGVTKNPQPDGALAASTAPRVSAELKGVADRSVAQSPLMKALAGNGKADLKVIKEGPWTDVDGNLLGVARVYRLSTQTNPGRLAFPDVRFVKGQDKYKSGKVTMRVTGLRELQVLVTTDGEIASAFPTERTSTSEVDLSKMDLSGEAEERSH